MEPERTHAFLFLLVARPVYCLGLTMFMLPLIVRNALFAPLREFMAHPGFAPYARLTYGVFLSHTIFIQFDTFNLETGFWAQSLINMCFAYLAISFLFSLVTYLFIEAPWSNLLNDFIREKKLPDSYGEPARKEGRRKKFGVTLDEGEREEPPRRRRKKKRVRTNESFVVADAEVGGSTTINDSLNESLVSQEKIDD